MKYLSLFSGIGGFELGIQQAYEINRQKESTKYSSSESGLPNLKGRGGEWEYPVCIGYSEIDKYAIQVYNKHFNHKNYGDINKINANDLPDFDFLVGGFPCQSFSIAGKRGGFNDTRGTMFFEIARIVREKQPRLLLLENVKGLLSHDKGRTFTTIIATLDELGYDCQWQVLNSKNFGVPQNRERVFIVGHLRGTSRPEVFPIGGATNNDIKVVGELNSETWQKRHECIRRVHDVKGLSPTIPTGTGGGVMNKVYINKTVRAGGRGSLTKKHNWDTHLIDGRVRRLTPKECERLQGFPDDWTKEGTEGAISDTQRYKMCGNAVTVNVIKEIMIKLLDK